MAQVAKMVTWVPISHEWLLDSGMHQCDASCPPPYMPPPVPLRTRLRYRLRFILWPVRHLHEYRLVHRDDIRDWRE
jgi:hypothetical protein